MAEPEGVDAAEPIYVGMAPCPGTRSINGRCLDCGHHGPSTKADIASQSQPGVKISVRRPLPHQREVRTYIIDNPGECSCGGFHGDLGQLERVSCLREKIGGEPKIICRSCGEPTSLAEPAPSAAATVRMVDETAKALMRAQGRDPATWDSLTNEVRDALRLLALDRLRRLA